MKRQQVIRKLIAGFVLLLFVFSATPKKWWHDAFANHQEYTSVTGKVNTVQQINTAISCKCEDLYAQSVFTVHEHRIELGTLQHSGDRPQRALPAFTSSTTLFIELRGPPQAFLLS